MTVRINAKNLRANQKKPSLWQVLVCFTKRLFKQTMSIKGCGYCDLLLLILGGLFFFVFGLFVGTAEILVAEYYPEYFPDNGDYWSDHETEVDTEEEDLELYFSAAEDDATSSTDIGTCVYCSLPIRGKPLQTCIECNGYNCHGCLRMFFLLATQNEECMPPRCCGMAIPLAIGRQVLTGTEVETFKEKHEEWNTAKRCYCPMPACSAFLSPRLFPELRGEGPVINCPECSVAICTACVGVAHEEWVCARDDDITPELDWALKEVGAKRCPKCRTAVEKVDDVCSSMRCRCGANWCWHCSRDVEVCEGWPCETMHGQLVYFEDEACSSSDEDFSGLETPQTTDSEDDAVNCKDYGDKIKACAIQDNKRTVPFNCLHGWRFVEHWEFDVGLQFECECCWGLMLPCFKPPGVSLACVQTGRFATRPEDKMIADGLGDGTMFTCAVCSSFVCNKCRKEIDAGVLDF
ncbi:hypothetical protein SI65_01007 [Aspergillus cristatus]|uniref:RING-type domain-containing protein n=1 Tax=Aspergillus cristatus TaxID=573508 RepID=A0A1E3BR51_ASPCR|nr:hypothetical protein SI65_01007 [Aspergillus cristatus]